MKIETRDVPPYTRFQPFQLIIDVEDTRDYDGIRNLLVCLLTPAPVTLGIKTTAQAIFDVIKNYEEKEKEK